MLCLGIRFSLCFRFLRLSKNFELVESTAQSPIRRTGLFDRGDKKTLSLSMQRSKMKRALTQAKQRNALHTCTFLAVDAGGVNDVHPAKRSFACCRRLLASWTQVLLRLRQDRFKVCSARKHLHLNHHQHQQQHPLLVRGNQRDCTALWRNSMTKQPEYSDEVSLTKDHFRSAVAWISEWVGQDISSLWKENWVEEHWIEELWQILWVVKRFLFFNPTIRLFSCSSSARYVFHTVWMLRLSERAFLPCAQCTQFSRRLIPLTNRGRRRHSRAREMHWVNALIPLPHCTVLNEGLTLYTSDRLTRQYERINVEYHLGDFDWIKPRVSGPEDLPQVMWLWVHGRWQVRLYFIATRRGTGTRGVSPEWWRCGFQYSSDVRATATDCHWTEGQLHRPVRKVLQPGDHAQSGVQYFSEQTHDLSAAAAMCNGDTAHNAQLHSARHCGGCHCARHSSTNHRSGCARNARGDHARYQDSRWGYHARGHHATCDHAGCGDTQDAMRRHLPGSRRGTGFAAVHDGASERDHNAHDKQHHVGGQHDTEPERDSDGAGVTGVDGRRWRPRGRWPWRRRGRRQVPGARRRHPGHQPQPAGRPSRPRRRRHRPGEPRPGHPGAGSKRRPVPTERPPGGRIHVLPARRQHHGVQRLQRPTRGKSRSDQRAAGGGPDGSLVPRYSPCTIL